MTILNSLAFIGAIFLLAVTPGPGIFATISRAIASGFTHATILIAGIVVGDIIFLLLAIYGLNFIAQTLGAFFMIIKYLGGVYLIYLGYTIYISKVSIKKTTLSNSLSWKTNFLSGLLITLSNPKVIIFYLGFLPAFMNLETLTTIDTTITIILVSTTLSSVLLLYAFLATKATKFLKNQKALNNLNRVSGGIMIGAGSLIILEN